MSKLLLYCTKAKPYLYKTVECLKDVCDKYYTYNNKKYLEDKTLNGKIIAECDFEVEEIEPCISPIDKKPYAYMTRALERWELVEHSCLSFEELDNYLKGKNGYAIHIKNLNIFDEPRELREYYNNNSNHIEKAPQNMMYARQTMPFKNEFLVKGILQEVRGYKVNEYVLISIQPQWMCLILNRIKDVEVRKVVLKEMLKND